MSEEQLPTSDPEPDVDPMNTETASLPDDPMNTETRGEPVPDILKPDE